MNTNYEDGALNLSLEKEVCICVWLLGIHSALGSLILEIIVRRYTQVYEDMILNFGLGDGL